MKNIYLIGSGKIAHNLALVLKDQNISITGINSRNEKTGKKLANKVNTKYYQNVIIPKKTNLVIICVSDDEIKNIAKKISNIPVIHTSGSSKIDLLKNCSNNYGVMWPIQTFSKNKQSNFKSIPICIETNNKSFFNDLKSLFSRISDNILHINYKQRKLIHLSAVISCNFSNYLYSISEEILSKEDLQFKYLKPLILETINNAFKYSPQENQTGPAKRKDYGTIKKHLDLLSLKEKKEYFEIYNLMTNSIIKHYEN